MDGNSENLGLKIDNLLSKFDQSQINFRGVSRIFERGGPISIGSLKKGHQILKGGGSNGLKGGSSTFVSLGRQILHI